MGPRAALALVALIAVMAMRASAGTPEPVQESGEPPPDSAAEPPPESADGVDYQAEPADSIEEGEFEVDVGATGRPGEGPRRRQRVRFSSDSLAGTWREGPGDPLSGGAIEDRGATGAFGFGRLAPRWGRGLVVGAAAEPWSIAPVDRGAGAAFRGRSGEGAWYRGGEKLAWDAFYGRFSRSTLAGVQSRAGAVGFGVVGARSRVQASLFTRREAGGSELAMDRAGRWRAEGALERRVGRTVLTGRVRGGLASFRSLAEPKRSGPAQALTVTSRLERGAGSIMALGSLWRFGSGLTGSRAAVEWVKRSGPHSALAVGLEQQQGARREPTATARARPLRQGASIEWRKQTPALELAIRHETWGSRWARHSVRSVTAARVEAALPLGSTLRVTCSAFRAKSGESLYLAERDADRLVLRALTGAGERVRIELGTPLTRGRLRAGLDLTTSAARPARVQWTLDWTRRSRMRRAR